MNKPMPKIDAEKVMKIDEITMRKWYVNRSGKLYVLIVFNIEFELSEGVECAKTIVLTG